MRRKLIAAFVLVLLTAGLAHADLNVFIRDVNVSASGNIGGYKADLGVRFGTSGPSLDMVLRSVDSPAEGFLVLWLGERSGKPVDIVLREYQSRKGQGWGEIAKSLGIKPGSADFHALRQGNLGWSPSDSGKGGGKGRK
jgi:hypothetical protein